MCIYSVSVLFCMSVVALRRVDHSSKESYRLCIGLRNSKSGQGPKGCGPIERDVHVVEQLGATILCSDSFECHADRNRPGLQPYKGGSCVGVARNCCCL
jgi:hypothetical protein